MASRCLNQGIWHAGLRIKENKEVYEGEVTELTPEETENQVHCFLLPELLPGLQQGTLLPLAAQRILACVTALLSRRALLFLTSSAHLSAA